MIHQHERKEHRDGLTPGDAVLARTLLTPTERA
jgi:hypothetical protein